MALHQVASVIRGAAPILPQDCDAQVREKNKWETELPAIKKPAVATYPHRLWSMIEERNGHTRREIGLALGAAGQVLESQRSNDTRALNKLIKAIDLVLNFNGVSHEKFMASIRDYRSLKEKYAKPFESAKASTSAPQGGGGK